MFNQLGAVVDTYADYYDIAVNRCLRLRDLGLLSDTDDITALANEAQNKLNTFAGFLTEQNLFQPVLPTLSEEVVATYASTLGRFHVEEQFAGISFAQVEGNKMFDRFPAPYSERDINVNMIGENLLGGISKMMKLINNNADGGPQENYYSRNAGETLKDGNLTAALQFYKLSVPGRAEWEVAGHSLTAEEIAYYDRAQAGVREAQLTGQMNGKPSIMIAGRSDEVVQVNHGARAYLARYMQRGGDTGNMAYLEIQNGHHLEMYNALMPAYGENSTYLNPYYEDAIDMMLDHLRNGTPLPGSQVVRAPMKGESDITPSMFPAIQMTPGASDAITWDGATNTLTVPE